ncbi:MAG: hypothetical protein V3575_01480 [Candidatus Absconditabacteria bacterium]
MKRKNLLGIMLLAGSLVCTASLTYGATANLDGDLLVAKFEKSLDKRLSKLSTEEKIDKINDLDEKMDLILDKVYSSSNKNAYYYLDILYSFKDLLDEQRTEIKMETIKDKLENINLSEQERADFKKAMLDLQSIVNGKIQNTFAKSYFESLKQLKLQDEGEMSLSAGLKQSILGIPMSYGFKLDLTDYSSFADFIDSKIDGKLSGEVTVKDGTNDMDIKYSMMFSMIQKNLMKYYKISDLETTGGESNPTFGKIVELLELIEKKGKYVMLEEESQINMVALSNVFSMFTASGLNSIAKQDLIIPLKKVDNKIYFIPSINLVKLFVLNDLEADREYYDMVERILQGGEELLPYIIIGTENKIGYEFLGDVDVNFELLFDTNDINSIKFDLVPEDLSTGKGFDFEYKRGKSLNFDFDSKSFSETVAIDYKSELSSTGIESINGTILVKSGDDTIVDGSITLKDNIIEGDCIISGLEKFIMKLTGKTNNEGEVTEYKLTGQSSLFNMEISNSDMSRKVIFTFNDNDSAAVGLSLVVGKDSGVVKSWDFKFTLKADEVTFAIANAMSDGDISGQTILKIAGITFMKANTTGTYSPKNLVMNTEYSIDSGKASKYYGAPSLVEKLSGNIDIVYKDVDGLIDFAFDFALKDSSKLMDMYFKIVSKSKQTKFEGEVKAPTDYETMSIQDLMY